MCMCDADAMHIYILRSSSKYLSDFHTGGSALRLCESPNIVGISTVPASKEINLEGLVALL